jgi:hypothetical protein
MDARSEINRPGNASRARPILQRVRTAWGGTPHWERALWWAAAGVFLVALVSKPVLFAADPHLRAIAVAEYHLEPDPWGTAYLRHDTVNCQFVTYSAGPNRIDESAAAVQSWLEGWQRRIASFDHSPAVSGDDRSHDPFSSSPHDPWGRPWVAVRSGLAPFIHMREPRFSFSRGPNGIDESTERLQVAVDEEDGVWGERAPLLGDDIEVARSGPLYASNLKYKLVNRLREAMFAGLGVWLIAVSTIRMFREERSEHVWVELGRAGIWSGLFVGVVVFLACWLQSGFWNLDYMHWDISWGKDAVVRSLNQLPTRWGGRRIVSGPASVLATALCLCWILPLCVRLRTSPVPSDVDGA